MIARSPRGNVCPECGGTGFVLIQREGRTSAAPCACRRDARAQVRIESAQIPARYRNCSLDNFELHSEAHRLARRRAEKVIDDLQAGVAGRLGRGLVLSGSCGSGKTHLAVGVLRRLVEDYGKVGLFAEFTDLLRRIQESFDRRSQTPSFAVLQPALDAEVLLLDDLGTMRMTPWVQDTLGLIINERYSNQRITLITTNLRRESSNNEEVLSERVGERVVSRLEEMCYFVDLDTSDYRKNARRANIHIDLV